MATGPMSDVVEYLRKTAMLPDGAGMTDGALLDAFVIRRDDAAFAALVRRHGPMVWGVCRRLLASHHDAEDAFQATFLVLVRKAPSVVPREMVGNWLYGVAYQTALNARATAARKRTRERQVTQMPEPAAPQQDLWQDLQGVLDQELSRLPEKYRGSIVLCDLEGKTRKDVAQQFGVPEGTLSGWLTRGREMLAKRLARRGLALSSGALAALLVQNAASASVPAPVVSSTINAACVLAAGQAAGAISVQVAALTQGVIKTMFVTKLKIATGVLLAVSAAGAGVAGLTYYVHAGKATDQPAAPARGQEDRPKLADANRAKPTNGTPRPAGSAAKFTLGRETTYVTGPLDNEGYVDYETALNERLAKVIPEKNANVLLWQALRPHPKRLPMPPEFFSRLGIPAPPERGEYFVELARYAGENLKLNPGEPIDQLHKERWWAAQRPWVEKDYPKIAGWLKVNEKPLAMVVEATRRPDYYNPLISNKSGDEGWFGLNGSLLPGAVQCSWEVAPALAARAMLYAGAGRFDEAWQDLLACHRLGRLIGRGADYAEFRISMDINQVAMDGELALLDRANPTAKQARAWMSDLEHLPAKSPVADQVDLGRRFTLLNTVMLARRAPVKTLRLIEFLLEYPRPPAGIPDPEPAQARLDSIDWDRLLRDGNRWCDRVVAAQRLQDRAARQQELKRIEEEFNGPEKAAQTPANVIKALREDVPADEVTTKLGHELITGFIGPTVHWMQRTADWNDQRERNLQLALALAAYHADRGRYPDKLDALTTRYLQEIPNDLFSGKALLYRPGENGYLLYSVGVNGLDEGGRGPDDTPPGDDPHVRMPVPELKRK